MENITNKENHEKLALLDFSILNKVQREVVEKAEGAALIVAGPGSGKTRTLVYKIAKLINDGASPSSILLLTFTTKAAADMKKKVMALLPIGQDSIVAGTFHHFSNNFLKENFFKLNFSSNYTILDESDALSLINEVVSAKAENEESKPKKSFNSQLRNIISLSKLRMISIEDVLSKDYPHLLRSVEEIKELVRNYEELKRKTNTLDFDDLLFYTYRILLEDKVKERYQNRFKYIFVDEFQDTDKLQAAILDLLYKKGNNLFVVGDDLQSIYSFRGAEIKNILDFEKKYDAKVYFLEQNYRSTKKILDLVNNSILHAQEGIKKNLISDSEDGVPPYLLIFSTRRDEAYELTNMIEEDLKNNRTVGVLFRTVYAASEVEVELAKRKIKYELRGGMRFFDQRHIKDILSFVRSIVNLSDRPALVRFFRLIPGVGEKKALFAANNLKTKEDFLNAIKKIEKKESNYSNLFRRILGMELSENSKLNAELTPEPMRSKNPSPAAIVDSFYEGFYKEYLKATFEDFEERKADIDVLVGIASRYPSIEEFSLSFTFEETETKAKSPLILSTIHQAKGLEWDSVYLIGLSEGILPSGRSENIEEERRLFYVAISRAKKTLIMSHSNLTNRFYGAEFLSPSRFIQEISEDKYEFKNME